MKQVIILVGASGCGKSTWAQAYIDGVQRLELETKATVVSADHYFTQPDGSYQFDGSKLATAHAQCKKNFILALQESVDLVIVDNTSTRKWERQDYVQEALNHDYSVWLSVFDTPAEVCAKRNTHGVSLEACQKMTARIDVPAGFYEIFE